MEFVICPKCSMRVLPKVDGTCPSCQAIITKQRLPDVSTPSKAKLNNDSILEISGATPKNMNSFFQTNEFDQTEKRFAFRFSWANVIVLILLGGVGTVGLAYMASSNDKPMIWLGATIFSLLFFMGAFVSIVNLFGNLHVEITKDKIFIPSIWKWRSPTRITFSDVSKTELLTLQGNTVLQLTVGEKKYAIADSWLPKKGNFQELVETVALRITPLSVEDLASIMQANNRDWTERLDAAEALAKLNDPRGLDFLKASLKINDPDIRGVAQEIITKLEKDKIIP